ncbi:hypothetical protein DFP73DRAFT_583390 [Morchella snyderi]|nr:hypothetical protein DFP73DRAFT_583390 [Morchella snyderi]
MSSPSLGTPNRRKNAAAGVCRSFANGTGCKKGERCEYKHEGEGTPASSPTPQRPRNRRGNRDTSRDLGRGRGRPNVQSDRGGGSNRGREGDRGGSSPAPGPSSSGRRVSELDIRPSPPTQKREGWLKYGDWEGRFGIQTKQSAPTMRYFWEEALDIVGGSDPNLIQKVVGRLVAKDNIGRELIEQVVKNDYSGSRLVLDYLLISVPFLLVLTHPDLINSLSIDRHVGTIYNYLYGTDGSTCLTFFRNLATQLENEAAIDARKSAIWKSDDTEKPMSFTKALACIVEGLRHTLKRNLHAAFNEDYKTLAESYCALAHLITQNDEFYSSINSSLTEIIGIHRRANLIIVLPTVAPAREGRRVVTSSFPVEVDYPGYLSSQGPRHDNDLVSIREIRILPTLEEVLSTRIEYLPYKSTSYPHFLAGVDRLFDTHFRLLRHDSIAGLRDAVGRVFDMFQLPPQEMVTAVEKAGLWNLQGHLYSDASVAFAKFDQRQGLELVLKFRQPPAAANKTPEKQKDWWDSQKSRFDRGTLACLVTKGSQDFRRIIFFTITKKETSGLATGKYGHISVQLVRSKEEENRDLEDIGGSDMDFVLGRLSRYAEPMTSVLVNFPGIIPATFVPVLDNLQYLSAQGNLPLSQWIAPSSESTLIGSDLSLDNMPPAYSRAQTFRWDLKPILKDPLNDFSLSPATQPNDQIALKTLEEMTTLDNGQCNALITGLTKEMSLIQGPPGTGKSYVGVQIVMVLLHNKKETDIGPIVCVCYTNHALDQFLLELKEKGIRKIIRVGGQSKSEELEGFNLKNVSRAAEKTRGEKNDIYQHLKSLDAISNQARTLCNDISKSPDSWDAISPILKREFPDLHNQLLNNEAESDYLKAQEQEWAEELEEKMEEMGIGGEDSGVVPTQNPWQNVSDDAYIWDAWRGLKHGPAWEYRNRNMTSAPYFPRSFESIVDCTDIWSLPWEERRILVEHLSKIAAESGIRRLSTQAQGFTVESEELHTQYNEVDRRCLAGADIIGITTTGLAKQGALLRRLRSKVVICEEAGEVLEGHLINAILPTCQHLIQIGDHQQLRPQISCFQDLSLESRNGIPYSLDESMFERLVRERPDIAAAQLNIQRRMRPEISSLIRNTLYPDLRDSENVYNYPDVVGMRKNVFWLDHTHPEAGSDNSGAKVGSHSNVWEVEMTHGLVRHLVRQSHYSSKDIAVLTPYTGQLQKLRRALAASFEVVLSEKDQDALVRDGLDESDQPQNDSNGISVKQTTLLEAIRVATVDNFQGEEAKIVIISLVRSNKERKVGFLRTTNRINVLLSRAKHGMYLIGNAESAGSIAMWRDVCQMLHDTNAIGKKLSLLCPRHRGTPIEVEGPQDFLRLSPEGGCDLTCDKRLESCGHRCYSKCHSDGMHKTVSCAQPCNRLHEACQHPCKRLCSDDCGQCEVPVYNFRIPCGHIEKEINCSKTLIPEGIICTKPKKKIVPQCRHSVEVRCYIDVRSETYKCPIGCTQILPCGHKCTGTCGSCNTVIEGGKVTKHSRCRKVCGRGFTSCNHRCQKTCHDGSACGLCDAQCDVKCGHSSCSMRCRESCAPCAEPCTWKCKHQGQCQMPCAAPCELLPCDERCDKILRCGHRCPSLCGETCPAVTFCQVCCSKERKEDTGVDMIEFSPYSSIDLDENPILVLSCGHFFTRETLDGYLELDNAYSRDNQGRYDGYIDPEGSLDEQVPKCPSCRQPLLQYSVRRYGRVINRAAIMEMTRRFLTSASTRHQQLQSEVVGLESKLINSRDAFYETLSTAESPPMTQTQKKAKLESRLQEIQCISAKLTTFIKTIKKQQQPATRLYQSTVTRKTSSTPEKLFQATLYFRPDTRLELLTTILYCRCNLLMVTENALLAHHLKSKAKNPPTGTIREALARPITRPINRPSGVDNMEILIDTVSQDASRKAKASFGICRVNINAARSENLPGAEVDAIGIFVRMVAIWRQLPQDPTSIERLDEAVKEAIAYLNIADKLCKGQFTGVDDMKEMLKVVRRQLCGGTFYQDITTQEMEAVVRAMKSELTFEYSTGRWYYCQNAHPFTVGECGRPMEEVKCPECNAPVGGTHHNPASGVRSAGELDAIARRV